MVSTLQQAMQRGSDAGQGSLKVSYPKSVDPWELTEVVEDPLVDVDALITYGNKDCKRTEYLVKFEM